MSIARWLIPGIWLVMLLSLGVLLYANAEIKASQQNKGFTLPGSGQSELKVEINNDGQRLVGITLYKPFSVAEQEFLTTVVVDNGNQVTKAMAYKLQFPLPACEFAEGLLVHCDSKNSQRYSVVAPYSISWLQEEGLPIKLTSAQLPEQGLQLSFYTSREKTSRLNTYGQKRRHCTLQAHLKISVFKSPQLNGVMAVEDVFFNLSERACMV